MKAIFVNPLLPVLVAAALALTILLNGCGEPAPAVTPRQALSASEVESIGSKFDSLMEAHWDACLGHDLKAVRPLYTEDVVVHDVNDVIIEGIMAVSGTACSTFFLVYPNYEGRPVANYVERNDGVYIEDSWGWTPDMEIKQDAFSENNPMVNYMWFTLRDGKIARWWMLYGEEVFAATPVTPFPTQILENYAETWSSGKPQRVADLYAAGAVYKDTLFGDNLQGSDAIKGFASDFFAWYPGVNLIMGKSFGDYPKAELIGSLYTLQIKDQKGKDCDVQALTILNMDTADQKIKEEWIFYKADSLIACGLAK